jgi:hypothetical protein
LLALLGVHHILHVSRIRVKVAHSTNRRHARWNNWRKRQIIFVGKMKELCKERRKKGEE